MRFISVVAFVVFATPLSATSEDASSWRLHAVKYLQSLNKSVIKNVYFTGDQLTLSVNRPKGPWQRYHELICRHLESIAPSDLDVDLAYYDRRTHEKFAELTCVAPDSQPPSKSGEAIDLGAVDANGDIHPDDPDGGADEDAENLGAVGADGIARSDAEHEASKAIKPHSQRR